MSASDNNRSDAGNGRSGKLCFNKHDSKSPKSLPTQDLSCKNTMAPVPEEMADLSCSPKALLPALEVQLEASDKSSAARTR